MKDNRMNYVIAVIAALALIIISVAGIWSCRAEHLAEEKFFAPKEADVERETFTHSRAYVDGTIQELEMMRLDYLKGNPEQKAALKNTILRRVAGFDTTLLPPNLQQFVNSLLKD